jgi:hypothetical protein
MDFSHFIKASKNCRELEAALEQLPPSDENSTALKLVNECRLARRYPPGLFFLVIAAEIEDPREEEKPLIILNADCLPREVQKLLNVKFSSSSKKDKDFLSYQQAGINEALIKKKVTA